MSEHLNQYCFLLRFTAEWIKLLCCPPKTHIDFILKYIALERGGNIELLSVRGKNMQNRTCSILACGSVGWKCYEVGTIGSAFALIYCLHTAWFCSSRVLEVLELGSAILHGLPEWKINSVHWTTGSLCDTRSFRWSWCLSIWILQGIDPYLQKFMASERRHKKQASNERIEFKNMVLNLIY